MAVDFDLLAEAAFKHGASDIHIIQENPIYLRIDGAMREVKGMVPTREDLEGFLTSKAPKGTGEKLDANRGADFGWQPNDRMRFRVAVYFERDKLRFVLRLIKMKILALDELDLPPVLKTIASWKRGLVLVTGVTGSGKSTTLAAIISEINRTDSRCIITIEDPIEMVHPNIKSVLSQREVGRDVQSFRQGLVQALRQDPDVILIGEMRDPETISTAILAAETGHYVFSTMHTTNALHTLERIFSEFPEAEHHLLREQLANNLRATLTQRLVKRAGGKGRVAALEIMVINDVIRKLMLDNRIPEIATVIRGRVDGMMLFDQHLADHVRANNITVEDALEFVEDQFAFQRYVRGVSTASDKGGILG